MSRYEDPGFSYGDLRLELEVDIDLDKPFSPSHPFFVIGDFWDRLFYVSELRAPDELRAPSWSPEEAHKAPSRNIGLEFDNADLAFLTKVIEGDVQGAYETLKERYELTQAPIYVRGGTPLALAVPGLGASVLEQCIEFAEYFGIEEPNLPDMIEDQRLYAFIDAMSGGELPPQMTLFSSDPDGDGSLIYWDGPEEIVF